MNSGSSGDLYLAALDCFSERWQKVYSLLYHDPSAKYQISHLICGALQHLGELGEKMFLIG